MSQGPPPHSGIKLFIGQIPRALSEEELRVMVEEYGNPTEVVVIKDRATGQSRGCGFVIYSTREEADRCINGLHNKRIIPPMHHPVQVKYAEGETHRLEAKLFVGMIAKSANEEEVRRIFEPFGEIDELAILKDRTGTSKGCAFLKFRHREHAEEAIRQLNGKYKMPDCPQNLTVQFADTERQKVEKRGAKAFQSQAAVLGLGALAQLTAGNPLAAAAAQLANAGFGGMPSGNPAAAAALAALAAAANPAANNSALAQYGGYYGGAPGGGNDLLSQYGQPNPFAAQSAAASNPYAYLYGGDAGGYQQQQMGGNAANLALAALQNSFMGGASLQNSYMSAALQNSYLGDGGYPGGAPITTLGRAPQQEGPPGANLFIYHLPEQFGDADLLQTFAPFGSVLSAHVYVDPTTNLSKGFGFVSYDSIEAASAAVMHMNGFQLGGKRLKVQVKKSNLPTAPGTAMRPY